MPNFFRSLFRSSRSRPRAREPLGRGSVVRPKGKSKERSLVSYSGGNEAVGLSGEAVQACSSAIDATELLIHSRLQHDTQTITRIITLLEAQREELIDLRPYLEGRRFPALLTLRQVYAKLATSMRDVARMPETAARETLNTLVGVLQEGPDYLIDVIILSAVVFQAEIIDPSFGSEVRHILDRAIEDQSDLQTFRRATESVIAISAAMPRDLLNDREGEAAYKSIGVLLKHLQVRVASSAFPTSLPSVGSSGSGTHTGNNPSIVTPLHSQSPMGTAPPSPALSPTPTASPSPSSSPSVEDTEASFRAYNASDLQAQFGTGQTLSFDSSSIPLPGLSSYRATVAPNLKSPAESVSGGTDTSEEEIWEYRGQRMTRSALDLVLREEALAQADSSGQYAGDVSWDDLRNTWIPKWVRKLKVSDLAEGEIPDTTPAGFKEKDEDEWGNKIGWYGPHKEMYYKEDPSFELRE